MSFARARAISSLQNGLRSGARPALRSSAKRAQLVGRRFASSEHGQKQSSDLPWLITSIAVTVPSCYYLWPTKSEHHDDHHDDSHDSHGKEEEAEPEEEKSGDDDAATEETKEEDKSDSKVPEEEKASAKPADVPAEGEGEAKPHKSNGNIEGVNFKGKVKEDSDANKLNVKVESDSKGASKKRLESANAKNLGPGHEQEGSDRDTTTTDGKQKGVSNTQTRHSIPIHEDPEKSKKPDGTPETSKHIGTVDPSKD